MEYGCLMGRLLDQAALSLFECTGSKWPVCMDGKCVSVDAMWHREGEKGQNLKNAPPQSPEGLTFWFSLCLCGSGQMIPGVGQ